MIQRALHSIVDISCGDHTSARGTGVRVRQTTTAEASVDDAQSTSFDTTGRVGYGFGCPWRPVGGANLVDMEGQNQTMANRSPRNSANVGQVDGARK